MSYGDAVREIFNTSYKFFCFFETAKPKALRPKRPIIS